MKKEQYTEELDKILFDFDLQRELAKNKIKDIYHLVQQDIANVFISNGYILEKHPTPDLDIFYYYNPNTNFGVKTEIPSYIDLDGSNSILSLSIIYRANGFFLDPNYKQIYFYFKKEESTDVFNRFKKATGKSGMKKILDILRKYHPDKMLIDDRRKKLKNLKS